MKVFLLLFLVYFAATSALPQRGFFRDAYSPFDESDYGESSEEGSLYPDEYSFGTMLRGMQEAMANMRKQLSDSFHRIPAVIPRFPSIPNTRINVGLDSKTPAKTTSEVKIIDGKKVTINETTYISDKGNAVYKIQTVDVVPHVPHQASSEQEPSVKQPENTNQEQESDEVVDDNGEIGQGQDDNKFGVRIIEHGTPEKDDEKSEETPVEKSEENTEASSSEITSTTTTTTTVQPSVQPSAEDEDNEIPEKSDEDEIMDSELTAFIHHNFKYDDGEEENQHERRSYVPDPNEVEIITNNQHLKPIDLSSDLRVNQILSDRVDAGALIMADPDSEFVEIVDGKIVPNHQAV